MLAQLPQDIDRTRAGQFEIGVGAWHLQIDDQALRVGIVGSVLAGCAGIAEQRVETRSLREGDATRAQQTGQDLLLDDAAAVQDDRAGIVDGGCDDAGLRGTGERTTGRHVELGQTAQRQVGRQLVPGVDRHRGGQHRGEHATRPHLAQPVRLVDVQPGRQQRLGEIEGFAGLDGEFGGGQERLVRGRAAREQVWLEHRPERRQVQRSESRRGQEIEPDVAAERG